MRRMRWPDLRRLARRQPPELSQPRESAARRCCVPNALLSSATNCLVNRNPCKLAISRHGPTPIFPSRTPSRLPTCEHARRTKIMKSPKQIVPDDAKAAVGHGIRARRSKFGAISSEPIEMEGSNASV
jgi:hypothetical protein